MSDGAWLIITGLLLTVVVLLADRCWFLWAENQRLTNEAWLHRLERDGERGYSESGT